MDTITSLVTNDRTARIALAVAVEPADPTTSKIIAKVGVSETLHLVTATGRVPGVDKAAGDLWRELAAPRLTPQSVQRALDATERLDLRVVVPGDSEWPAGMDGLGELAPHALWVRGDMQAFSTSIQRLVTITGARAATGYGEFVAQDLATGVVERGGVTVAGGAYGIEGQVHRATLAAPGTTMVVFANGLDRLYPAGHTELFERIVAHRGTLVSELPPGTAPTKWRFVQRARLLAAISGSSIVVEAGFRSGSLAVAVRAAALGRDVGAVPGPVTSAASSGPHELLRNGTARIIAGAYDIQMPARTQTDSLDPPAFVTERARSRARSALVL